MQGKRIPTEVRSFKLDTSSRVLFGQGGYARTDRTALPGNALYLLHPCQVKMKLVLPPSMDVQTKVWVPFHRQ